MRILSSCMPSVVMVSAHLFIPTIRLARGEMAKGAGIGSGLQGLFRFSDAELRKLDKFVRDHTINEIWPCTRG